MTFNGTAVWIYGAKGDNQGLYNVTLDDKTYYEDGYSSVYYYNSGQVLFFSGVGLASRLHSLFIVNLITDTAKPYLDIDSVSLGLVHFVTSRGDVEYLALTRRLIDRL